VGFWGFTYILKEEWVRDKCNWGGDKNKARSRGVGFSTGSDGMWQLANPESQTHQGHLTKSWSEVRVTWQCSDMLD
jgi:hypothetical protein